METFPWVAQDVGAGSAAAPGIGDRRGRRWQAHPGRPGLPHPLASPPLERLPLQGRGRRILLGLALAGLLLLAGCRGSASAPAERPLAASPPGGRLQEVAPPAAVQQLQAALAERSPQLRITAPRDGQTLPAGDWSLRLEVRDWPLVDAGSLGLGPHVVVQIDDQPPLRLTDRSSLAAGPATPAAHNSQSQAGQNQASPNQPRQGKDVQGQLYQGQLRQGQGLPGQGVPGQDVHRLEVVLPALSPGSHRVTAYAATPWGEAVKAPGAWQQLRLQRLLANDLAVPAAGTPQLIPVSPDSRSTGEPVLLDWLLLDAPLQHLQEGDGSWRLRVSLNGDSFLVDQNAPLWLRGWRPGSNALQLELVDGRGEPLNPPFNSLVQEVVIADAAAPRWQGGRLTAAEFAALLGEPSPEPLPESPAPAAALSSSAPEPSADTTGTDGPASAASGERASPPAAAPVPPPGIATDDAEAMQANTSPSGKDSVTDVAGADDAVAGDAVAGSAVAGETAAEPGETAADQTEAEQAKSDGTSAATDAETADSVRAEPVGPEAEPGDVGGGEAGHREAAGGEAAGQAGGASAASREQEP